MDPGSSKQTSRPTDRNSDHPQPTARTLVQPRPPVESFLLPPQLPDELGRLGSYRVLAELGRGGMGIVYRAEETDLKRQVALKVMLPEVANDARAKARFVREAQAQAKVTDDHVVAIYRVGEENGVPFIAMPLLKGQTLAEALRKNPRPPVSEVVRIGREMALGLAAAHASGLIHRDIKPGNVWLEGAKRRVKILDFGLARPTEAGANSADDITTTGAILGTPAFMSPEQARSQPIDHRTDLFSLGVVLYQMATGQRPFAGASAFDVMAAVVSYEPPLTQTVAPDLPAELGKLIHQLIAKDPNRRPANAETVADALEAIERELIASPTRVVVLPVAPGVPNPWVDIESTNFEADSESEPQALASQTIDSKSDESRADPKTNDSQTADSQNNGSKQEARQSRQSRLSRKSPQKSRLVLWLCAASGVIALVAVGIVVVKFAKPKNEPVVEKDKQNPPVEPKPNPPKPDKKQPSTQPQPFTPGPEYKAAEPLIHYANLKVKLASGKEMLLERGKPLPLEDFVVIGIEFQMAVSAMNVEKLFLPAVMEMKSLTFIKADVWMFEVTEAQLLALAKSHLAKTVHQLELGFELNPTTFEALKNFSNLSFLACDATRVDDTLLERLRELQLKQIGLEYLGQLGNVTDRGLIALAKLPVNRISMAGAVATPKFIRLMREHSAVAEFNCWGTKITDEDLKALAQCSRLQHVEMGGNDNITDVGLKHLEAMSQLRFLNVRDTKVTEKGVMEFVKKVPRCRVSWSGGITEPKP